MYDVGIGEEWDADLGPDDEARDDVPQHDGLMQALRDQAGDAGRPEHERKSLQ